MFFIIMSYSYIAEQTATAGFLWKAEISVYERKDEILKLEI